MTVGPQVNTNAYGLAGRPQFPAYLNFSSSPSATLPADLAQTGAFDDPASFTLNPGFIPYTPTAPFWSDGAIKERWMGLPYSGGPQTPANQIAFSQDGNWDFPAGTVFVKHFGFVTNEVDPSAPLRRLETRLLVYAGQGIVYGATYKWLPDNSNAVLLTSSQTEDILITTATGVRTQQWYYPSPSDCQTCHTLAAGGLLGVSKTRQLNAAITYPSTGVTDNQIRTLNRLGMLNPALTESAIAGLPAYAPATNTTASLELRARSFLDVNCAYCHHPGGTGRAAFDLRITTPLDQAHLINATVTSTFGIPGAKAIVPGDEVRSIVYHRVASTDLLARMPPLARNTVDTTDLAVLGQWIDSLYGLSPALNLIDTLSGPALSWPVTTNTFYLEASTTLDSGGAWVPGPSAGPAVGGTNYVLPLSATNQALYYRLNSQAPLP